MSIEPHEVRVVPFGVAQDGAFEFFTCWAFLGGIFSGNPSRDDADLAYGTSRGGAAVGAVGGGWGERSEAFDASRIVVDLLDSSVDDLLFAVLGAVFDGGCAWHVVETEEGEDGFARGGVSSK